MSIWQVDRMWKASSEFTVINTSIPLVPDTDWFPLLEKLQSFGGPKITGDDGRFPLEVATIAHRRLSWIRSDGPAHHNRDTEGTVQGVTRDTFVGLVPDDALPYICATYDLHLEVSMKLVRKSPRLPKDEQAPTSRTKSSPHPVQERVVGCTSEQGERKNRQLGMEQGAFSDPCVAKKHV